MQASHRSCALRPTSLANEVQALTKGAVPDVEELVLGDMRGVALNKEQNIANQLANSIVLGAQTDASVRLVCKDQCLQTKAIYYLQDGTATPVQFPEGLQQLARDYINAQKATQETKKISQQNGIGMDRTLPGGSNYREVLLKVPSTRPKYQEYVP